MTAVKKLPAWLTLNDYAVTVVLSKPIERDGVTVDKLTLRAPTVADERAAQAAGGDNAVERELALFSSLTECGSKDLSKLLSRDWRRLQEGFFRLDEDDGL